MSKGREIIDAWYAAPYEIEADLAARIDAALAAERAAALEEAAEAAFERMRYFTARSSEPRPDGMPEAAWRQRVSMWIEARDSMHVLGMDLTRRARATRGQG